MNILPGELLQTIATYLKPVALAEKTIEELLKIKEDINIALKEKNTSKHRGIAVFSH